MGAENIYYIDIDERKIEFAKTLGFCEYTDGVQIDCALEGTGYSNALEQCLKAVKPHGRVVLMGNPAGDVSMTQNTYWYILRKELTVLGTWNSSYNDSINDWKESLSAMASGAIDVKPLISHKYALKDCNEAFAMMRERKEFYNKVMLTMNEEEN